MKKKKYILSIFFNLLYLIAFSQGEFIIEIDRTDGSFTKTGPAIADVTFIYPEDRTYDENTGRFYFTTSLLNHSILSIDVSDGSIVNNPLINDIKAFQFDNSTNTLYALQHDDANNSKNFISIDPITGIYSQIGNSLPGSSMFSGAYSAFNELSHTYVFLSPPDILYSINAATGSVLFNPVLILAQGENLINFTFDNSTGILYGILHDNLIDKFFLVTIDPATGISTRIGSGTTFGTGNGSAAIDEANQQFIYMYTDDGHRISTVDISTGTVIHNALISPINFPHDNAYGLEYDNVRGKLYSIHWDNSIETTGINNIHSSSGINILPNPFSGQTTLQIDNSLKNGTLTLYNLSGQRVKQLSNIIGKTVIFNCYDLPCGLYYLQLTQDNQTIATDKLVITGN